MKVRNYMPIIYENNLEMNALLYSEEQEFDTIEQNIDDNFKDNFIKTATENGIENYEKIFSITIEPTEDLEFRRERILNRRLSHIPFTKRYLAERLDAIIGEDQWELEIDYANYTLDIYIVVPGHNWYNELLLFLENIIPCNIVYRINVYKASWGQVNDTYATWQAVKDACSTWEDVVDGLWLNN